MGTTQEQILEAPAYKTTAVRPLTTHLTNYQSKTNKNVYISEVLLWIPTHIRVSVGRPLRIYTSALCGHWVQSRGPTIRDKGCPRGVMVKAMNCGIVVREFVLQSRYYVHFRANTLGKGMNPLILPPAMGK